VRPGRAADHSHSYSAAVMVEYSYTFTHPLGHTGPVKGSLYLFYYRLLFIRWRSSSKSRTQQRIEAIYLSLLRKMSALYISVIFCRSTADR